MLFAGIIVCIALLGMFALGVSFLYGLAVAAAIGVLFTMVAALTLLPALLGFIGPRVLSRRQKRELATNGPRIVGAGTKGFWPRWAAFIQAPARSSRRWCALVVVVLVALPFFSLRLGLVRPGQRPGRRRPPGTAYDLLADGLRARLQRPAPAGDRERRARPTQPTLDRLAAAVQRPARRGQGGARRSPSRTKDGQTVSLVTVYPTTRPRRTRPPPT